MIEQYIRDRSTAVNPWPLFEESQLDDLTRVRVGGTTAKRAPTTHFFHEAARTARWNYVAIGALPIAHAFFSDSTESTKDPLLLAEFTRQGVEVISDLLLDVAVGNQFVLKSVKLTTIPDFERDPSSVSAQAVVVLPRTNVRWKGGIAYAVDGPFYCYVGVQAVAQFLGTVALMDREAYTMLRGGDSAPKYGMPDGFIAALEPASVGKQRQENVLIGEAVKSSNGTSAMIVPQARPPFFDRPLDHYPGMLMAEAARQLAVHHVLVALNMPPSRLHVSCIDMEFLSFAELHTPPILNASTGRKHKSELSVEIVARQERHIRSRFVVQMHLKNTMEGGA